MSFFNKNKTKTSKIDKVYLDNAATTRVDDEVLKAMLPYFTENFGNASSQHFIGQEAKRALEDSREIIAKSINAHRDEIIFTSGGTESNNFALKGLFFSNKHNKNHIITTKIEHDCVLNACKWLETQGAEITHLSVDENGFIDLKELENAITNKTLVVSIIHGNNEIGTIQDLEAIGKICKKKNVYFHSDACQSYTKTNIDVNKMNLDLLTLNSHKIHGPKGVGALYIKKSIQDKLTPLLHGGGHEFKLRSSTENVSGIVGFAKAVSISNNKNIKHMEKLQNLLINGILEIENTNLNGTRKNRLCNNINVRFNNIEGEAIGGFLDSYGISSSTGSACASHSLQKSHVLKAIGLNDIQINSSIRLSLSKYNTEEEILYVLDILKKVIERLRKISPIK